MDGVQRRVLAGHLLLLSRNWCVTLDFLWDHTNAESVIANRTLEDVDTYYRSNPSLVVIKDPDAISVKRPLKYIQHEDHEMQKIQGIKAKKNDDQTIEYVE